MTIYKFRVPDINPKPNVIPSAITSLKSVLEKKLNDELAYRRDLQRVQSNWSIKKRIANSTTEVEIKAILPADYSDIEILIATSHFIEFKLQMIENDSRIAELEERLNLLLNMED